MIRAILPCRHSVRKQKTDKRNQTRQGHVCTNLPLQNNNACKEIWYFCWRKGAILRTLEMFLLFSFSSRCAFSSLFWRAPYSFKERLKRFPPVLKHAFVKCDKSKCLQHFILAKSSPRSISEAFGLWEYGVPLYTASSSFSFTWVTVSQLRVFTVTSGAFSFSGFTQCSVYMEKLKCFTYGVGGGNG